MSSDIKTAPKLIALRGLNGEGKFFQVDAEDYDRVVRYKWSLTNKGYCRTTINGELISIHRFIMGCVPGDGVIVDHENNDRLNNTKGNLKFNNRNTSYQKSTRGICEFQGVGITGAKYVVAIVKETQNMRFGTYDDLEDTKYIATQIYKILMADRSPHRELNLTNENIKVYLENRIIHIKHKDKVKSYPIPEDVLLPGEVRKSVAERKLVPCPIYVKWPLSTGEFTLIDLNDINLVKPYTWSLCKDRVSGFIKGKKTLLHRHIMGCSPGDGKTVDHFNHEVWDNRKSNLIINPRNHYHKLHSGGKLNFQGVSYEAKHEKYTVAITKDSKPYRFGNFLNLDDAKLAAIQVYSILLGNRSPHKNEPLPKSIVKVTFDKPNLTINIERPACYKRDEGRIITMRYKLLSSVVLPN